MSARGTVLIVEDDGAIREFIAEILSDEGYHVRLVSDAVGDMAALADGQPDLILLDYHLPAANGLTVARCIRSIDITVPIVLMTADHHSPEHPDMANIAFCLHKPFDLDELLACIAAHIRISRP